MLERNWKQNSMARTMSLTGAKLVTTVTREISIDDLLEFVQENWLEIPVTKREQFKLETQKLELGLKEPPKPDYDPDEIVRW